MSQDPQKQPLRLPRREFCRHVVVGLATSFAAGLPVTNWFVADVQADELLPGQFLLNLEDYPALANVTGSVVLTLPGAPNGLANIVVTRAASEQFYAVDSTCAHNQCEVPPSTYNAASQQNEITCSCHGSRYKANGELLGGPAQRGLRAFVAALIAPGQLKIDLLDLRFQVQAAIAQPINNQNRIRLAFPALAFMNYTVRFRACLQDGWTTVPFARFFNGALDQTVMPGIGRDEEMFVAAPQPAGFFLIATV